MKEREGEEGRRLGERERVGEGGGCNLFGVMKGGIDEDACLGTRVVKLPSLNIK